MPKKGWGHAGFSVLWRGLNQSICPALVIPAAARRRAKTHLSVSRTAQTWIPDNSCRQPNRRFGATRLPARQIKLAAGTLERRTKKERRQVRGRGAQHNVFRRTLLTPLEPVWLSTLRFIEPRNPKVPLFGTSYRRVAPGSEHSSHPRALQKAGSCYQRVSRSTCPQPRRIKSAQFMFVFLGFVLNTECAFVTRILWTDRVPAHNPFTGFPQVESFSS